MFKFNQKYLGFLPAFITLLGLTVGPVVAWPAGGSAEQKPLKLGAILCLTGDLEMHCGAFREGIELALNEINLRGGVQGRKLEVDIQDSGRLPKTAQTIARKFGADEKILGVITSTFFEAKNSSPAMETFGLPSLILWDSTPELEAMGKHTFAIGPWAPSTYEESSNFAKVKLKAKRAAIVATIEEWAQSVANGFEETFKGAGGELVERIDVNAAESDFRSIIARIAKKDPDVVYVPVVAHLEVFVRQSKEQSLRAKLLTSDNITAALLRANPGVFEGVYQSMVADPEGPESLALSQKYLKYFGRNPELILFVGWAYDAVNLFAQAIERGGPDRAGVSAALASVKGYPGATGNITMNDGGSSRMMASIFEIRNNQFVPVVSAAENLTIKN